MGTINLTIHERIVDLRILSGLSQKELCEKLDIPASTLSRIERGEITNISNDNVQTKIFYHRKNKDDKSNLAKIIKNLIKIIGQDELIRRTGGVYQTIEFISQTIIE